MKKLQVVCYKKSLLIASLLVIALATASCADLQVIRKFADISTESATYTRYVDDFVVTVERTKEYQNQTQHATLDRIIKERTELKPGLYALHNALGEYMKALGELASDDLISYDGSLTPLSNNLVQNNLLSKERAGAYSNIAGFLAGTVTQIYRQNQLKEIIGDFNGDIQTIVSALEDFVKDYQASIDNELAALDKFYGKILIEAKTNPPQHASIQLLKERQAERKELLVNKENAANSYIKILTKIGDGHQLLYDKRNTITSKQLLSEIRGYGTDIYNLYKTVRALN